MLQIVQDNVVKFLNLEKPGPTARCGACLHDFPALAHSRARRREQELSVSLVDNALQQLKQLKGQA